ncbi:MAG: lipopolysaccharide heptosyltransferase II [Victivallales bacterium]|nr:lipopolysaccharide heptosyltransferase II [Victivallales bacterium]
MEYQPVIQNLGTRPCLLPSWHNGVLLRSTNWLGDALMTLPATYQLRRLMPDPCGFFVLCPKFLKPLWQACPWVDIVIGMEDKRITSAECEAIRIYGAGLGIVFPNSFGAALDVWRIGLKQRLGRAGRGRTLLLTNPLPEWPRVKNGEQAQFHQLSWYLDLIAAIGPIEWSPQCPPLTVDGQLAVDLGIAGPGWLALAPGAAYGPAKQWPQEHFLEIARRQTARGGRVVLVGTAKERSVTEAIASQVPGTLDLAGRTTLPQLMSILAAVDAVVANDSGAMHLAAAVGTSGVALFGSTDPIATGPIGAPWRILVADTPCRPCFARTCSQPNHPYHCLHSLTPDNAWQELLSLSSK